MDEVDSLKLALEAEKSVHRLDNIHFVEKIARLEEEIEIVQQWVSENGKVLPTEFLHLLSNLDWLTKEGSL